MGTLNGYPALSRVTHRGEHGTVLRLGEPTPGWHRALVRWDCREEQWVDVEKLKPEQAAVEDDEPTEPQPAAPRG